MWVLKPKGTMEAMDELLSSGEVARRLGISAERVRQFAQAGRLPYVRAPLGRLYRSADVERLLAERMGRKGTEGR